MREIIEKQQLTNERLLNDRNRLKYQLEQSFHDTTELKDKVTSLEYTLEESRRIAAKEIYTLTTNHEQYRVLHQNEMDQLKLENSQISLKLMSERERAIRAENEIALLNKEAEDAIDRYRHDATAIESIQDEKIQTLQHQLKSLSEENELFQLELFKIREENIQLKDEIKILQEKDLIDINEMRLTMNAAIQQNIRDKSEYMIKWQKDEYSDENPLKEYDFLTGINKETDAVEDILENQGDISYLKRQLDLLLDLHNKNQKQMHLRIDDLEKECCNANQAILEAKKNAELQLEQHERIVNNLKSQLELEIANRINAQTSLSNSTAILNSDIAIKSDILKRKEMEFSKLQQEYERQIQDLRVSLNSLEESSKEELILTITNHQQICDQLTLKCDKAENELHNFRMRSQKDIENLRLEVAVAIEAKEMIEKEIKLEQINFKNTISNLQNENKNLRIEMGSKIQTISSIQDELVNLKRDKDREIEKSKMERVSQSKLEEVQSQLRILKDLNEKKEEELKQILDQYNEKTVAYENLLIKYNYKETEMKREMVDILKKLKIECQANLEMKVNFSMQLQNLHEDFLAFKSKMDLQSQNVVIEHHKVNDFYADLFKQMENPELTPLVWNESDDHGNVLLMILLSMLNQIYSEYHYEKQLTQQLLGLYQRERDDFLDKLEYENERYNMLQEEFCLNLREQDILYDHLQAMADYEKQYEIIIQEENNEGKYKATVLRLKEEIADLHGQLSMAADELKEKMEQEFSKQNITHRELLKARNEIDSLRGLNDKLKHQISTMLADAELAEAKKAELIVSLDIAKDTIDLNKIEAERLLESKIADLTRSQDTIERMRTEILEYVNEKKNLEESLSKEKKERFEDISLLKGDLKVAQKTIKDLQMQVKISTREQRDANAQVILQKHSLEKQFLSLIEEKIHLQKARDEAVLEADAMRKRIHDLIDSKRDSDLKDELKKDMLQLVMDNTSVSHPPMKKSNSQENLNLQSLDILENQIRFTQQNNNDLIKENNKLSFCLKELEKETKT